MWELTKIFMGMMAIGTVEVLRWILVSTFWFVSFIVISSFIYNSFESMIKQNRKSIEQD